MTLDAVHILLICLIIALLVLVIITPAVLADRGYRRGDQWIAVLALVMLAHAVGIYCLS